MTAPFTAGRHFFTVTLLDGAAVQRLRAERRKNTGPDYVATVRRLGLDVGDGPVSRAKAEEAMAFVQGRAAELASSHCGDIALPDGALRVAGFQPASIAGPATAPGESGVGHTPVSDPGAPLIPPVAPIPPSPVPETPETPSPVPTPGPTPTPAPTPGPAATPSPVPPQPPGSAVTPSPVPSPLP
jgi:hypothetical protein